jgi:hypothetical protein
MSQADWSSLNKPMSFINRLFRAAPTPAAAVATAQHSHLVSGYAQQPRQPDNTRGGTRREMLRVVLRDTLHRHGIPATWIAAEVLLSTSRAGRRGVHWRLVIKHWDERLMTHSISLQQNLIKRVLSLDPLASEWLNGVSWQLDVPDDTVHPPMPAASTWVAPAPTTQQPAADAKSDLEQLFAVRDADYQQHGPSASEGDDPGNADDATQPMYLRTEPAKL